MTDKMISRRGFIGATAVAIPVTAIFASRTAAAQAKAMPHLDPNDPVAKALMYTHDASKIDKAKVPNFKAGSDCANCVQVQAASGAWRPCTAFPGKLVAEKGWCSAWAPKPA
ncbi:MAG: high-potential iron-sulfur protein [Gammaproteobacteria bacterium]|nr:MAG: high-potential iron-sulfur protein [Gammaproteobacteria bacterium]